MPINISRAGIEMNGTLYTSSDDFVVALRRLHPKEVRFKSTRDAPYEKVEEALRAFQRSGIHAKTGFVGNMLPENQQ